jgi:tripartite-type tricarboxylate transporter receptor subunit TctC
MKPHRRQFLLLAAGVATLPAVSCMARAQAYPTRPVRIVVGFAAGGGNDIVARLIGQWLSDRLGQPVLIENRIGAGDNIAIEAVVISPPDGYTLLQISSTNARNTTLYEKLKFVFHRDIAPVASIMRVPNVFDVNPLVSVKTVTELVAYAKANPGKLNMGSAGSGSSQHLAGELFKMMTGVNLVHAPYRGGALATTDLIGGQVQVMFDVLPESIQYIRTGKVRPLGMTTANRLEMLPDVPAVGDFVPGYEVNGFYGLGAPRNTHPEIVDKLNREINAALADVRMKARLAELGGTVIVGSPADFGKLIAEETEKWAKVIRAANIKAE